jgi:uncharacterized protein YukE
MDILLCRFETGKGLFEMRLFHSDKGITSIQVGVALSLVILLFFFAAFLLRLGGSSRLKTALEKTTQKTQLVQTMRSELLASAEAEKSAVMADTDEASNAFAEESMQASQSVEKARIELEALTRDSSRETKLLDDFSSCWGKLREVDKEVLSLAVQNTNLKALRLSFGPAASDIRNMSTALNQLMDSTASSPHAAEIIRLASNALTDAFNIYALQAPHIAETTDAEMERIETSMKQYDGQVRDALNRLEALLGDSNNHLLGEARKSYQDFQTINAQIIDLSRRNSNIRSFAVSMGQKRNTMAECLNRLDALNDAVREGVTFKATR